MRELPNLDYRMLAEAKFKKESIDNRLDVNYKGKTYRIEYDEEAGHNLHQFSVIEIDPETIEQIKEIYSTNDLEEITELFEDGFMEWHRPEKFIEYLDQMGKLKDTEAEKMKDLEDEWSREGNVKLAIEEVESPEEEMVVPDIAPKDFEIKDEHDDNVLQSGGLIEQVKKLIAEGNYAKAIDTVLELKLTKVFDIKELSSHLKHGQLFNLIEKYNLNFKDLMSEERIAGVIESLKKVVKMYEQKRRLSDDSLPEFLASQVFKSASLAAKLLNFDLMGYVKETYPKEFYEYPSIEQTKTLEDVSKLRQVKVTNTNHREFAYTVVPSKERSKGWFSEESKGGGEYKFFFSIDSTDDIFPKEIFTRLNKHGADGERPVAFVFGTYTPNKALWVNEMQSDIIQRAQMYLQSKDKALQKFHDRITMLTEQYPEITTKINEQEERKEEKEVTPKRRKSKKPLPTETKQPDKPELIKQLKDLGVKDEIELGKQKGTHKLVDMSEQELRSLLFDVVKDRITKDKKNLEKAEGFSGDFMPQYEQFRSKIQNYYSGWNIIAMNAVLNFARDNNIPTVYVASADLLYKKWLSHQSGDFTTELYKRMYDDMVTQTYGATREGDWYKIELKDVIDKVAKKHGMMKLAIREEEWDVWNYDVWGNEEDGWEVNDRSKWGIVVLPENPTLAQIIKALRRIEFLGGKATVGTIEEDMSSDENNIYLNESATGRPICGLERIPDTSSERDQTDNEKTEVEIKELEDEWNREGSKKRVKYYRGGGEGSMPGGITAQDVIDYEVKELGNSDIQVEKGIDLKNIKAENLVWVTITKGSAKEYGDVEEQEYGNHRVIARDSNKGLLIEILGKEIEIPKDKLKREGSGNWYEKDGRNLMEFENSDLNLTELKNKLKIAIEGHEDDELINLIKKDIDMRKQSISDQYKFKDLFLPGKLAPYTENYDITIGGDSGDVYCNAWYDEKRKGVSISGFLKSKSELLTPRHLELAKISLEDMVEGMVGDIVQDSYDSVGADTFAGGSSAGSRVREAQIIERITVEADGLML